jgi:hypothetical protein
MVLKETRNSIIHWEESIFLWIKSMDNRKNRSSLEADEMCFVRSLVRITPKMEGGGRVGIQIKY